MTSGYALTPEQAQALYEWHQDDPQGVLDLCSEPNGPTAAYAVYARAALRLVIAAELAERLLAAIEARQKRPKLTVLQGGK